MTSSNSETKQDILFGKEKNPSHIMPEKLTLDSKIQFRCHPGVSCFTSCCGHINIILTPYDILCLRKRIGIDSDELLLRYTKPVYLEKTDMPGVQIHLTDEGRCPFVTDEGCLVYTDRPSACRYYPIGMANFHEGAQEEQTSEKFFFKVKESYCKGHDEDKVWTVREWRADQGVDVRDDMNRGWMELVMRRKSFGQQATLSEPAKKMFFMASTNLEKFRDFIFHSSFLQIYDIDAATLKRDPRRRYSPVEIFLSLLGLIVIRDQRFEDQGGEDQGQGGATQGKTEGSGLAGGKHVRRIEE